MISGKLASQIIIEILVSEMGMSDQRVYIKDQNRVIPPDDEMSISVGMVDAKAMSTKTRLVESGVDPDIVVSEENYVRMRENIQIDVFSRNTDAITKRWEVIAALNSIKAQQAQEENLFRIFNLPNSFLNTSSVEGGSRLNRFTLLFPCFVWYKKTKILQPDGDQYYDEFTTRVDDEVTIGEDEGLFEFTINEDTEL